MTALNEGDKAPDFRAKDQNGEDVRLSDFAGKKVLLYFYPKANTSGWTTQAESVRDARKALADRNVIAVGISPDTPDTQKRFDEKFDLGFRLLSDADHRIADRYGTWGEKKMYGKTFMGIVRSSFLIDENGVILRSWYGISPKNTIPELLKALN